MLALKIHVFIKVSACVFFVYMYIVCICMWCVCVCLSVCGCGVIVVMVKFLRENYFHQLDTDVHMPITHVEKSLGETGQAPFQPDLRLPWPWTLELATLELQVMRPGPLVGNILLYSLSTFKSVVKRGDFRCFLPWEMVTVFSRLHIYDITITMIFNMYMYIKICHRT